MKKFIETVENRIKLIHQLGEYGVDVSYEDILNTTHITFRITPSACHNIISKVVINILIDVANQFGFSYYVSYSSDISKPQFVLYMIYDISIDQ